LSSFKKYPTWDSLPEALTAQQISNFLKISRKSVYELFRIPAEQGGIPYFQVGGTKKTDKEDLKHWITKMKQEKALH
jgi:excisionase family DNA binding protein